MYSEVKAAEAALADQAQGAAHQAEAAHAVAQTTAIQPEVMQPGEVGVRLATTESWASQHRKGIRNTIAVTVVGLVASFGVDRLFFAGSSSASTPKPTPAGASGQPLPAFSGALAASQAKNCTPLTLNPSSFPGRPNAILPAGPNVSSSDQASTYSSSLFSNNNLGNRVDPVTEATMFAVIGNPATSSGTQAELDIHTQFESAYNQMTGSDTSKADHITAAQRFCAANALIMGETVGYSSDAIAANTPYTQINGVVGKNGHNYDISFDTTISKHQISGITYRAQAAGGNGVSGFYEVVVPTDKKGKIEGPIDILGPLPTQSNKKGPNSGSSASSPDVGSAPLGSTPAGSSGPNGKINEHLPGTPPEFSPTPGPHPTPGPTATAPPETSPPATAPPETSPPATSPPATSPPTTGAPKTSVPPTTDPWAGK
jgi:hypothetical protein